MSGSVPDGAARGRVLIGGVGYRWMRDGSFGVVAADALARLDWPAHVEVSDLGYGAILVAQDLMYAEPRYSRLIVVAAVERGRPAGTLHRYRWRGGTPDAEEIQARIAEAGGGVLDVDHLLIIATYFGVLPEDVVVIEFEPVDTSGGEEMSSEATRCLESLPDVVRGEALRSDGSESSLPLEMVPPIDHNARRRSWSSLPS